MNNPCVCDPGKVPFKCERHCMIKSRIDYGRCNGSLDYNRKFWNIFERGEYPGQECTPEGPVDESKIKRKKKSCDCNKRKKWLNRKVPGLGTAVEWTE